MAAMRRRGGLESRSDDLVDGVEMFRNRLRRKHFSTVYETIVIEDGTVSDVGHNRIQDWRGCFQGRRRGRAMGNDLTRLKC